MRRSTFALGVWILGGFSLALPRDALRAGEDSESTYHVGMAKIDITPKEPIRLNGFGFRRTEFEGVTQKIWARALALDDGRKNPVLLITVDILGIPNEIRRELVRRFEKKAGLKAGNVAIAATHTHTAPMLKGANTTIFGEPIPTDHLDHIARYTTEFIDRLEKVGLEALENSQPARLTWGIGRVGFASNRRTKGGPVDHDLPMLVVRDLKGKIQAVYVSYACHCVTLSSNKVSGDWAGFAAQAVEDEIKGAMALVSVGCGADANPISGVTGDKIELASRQGMEIATEVKRMLGGYLTPVIGKIETRMKQISLPLDKLLTQEEWETRAKENDAIGHHARVQLDKLAHKEKLPTQIDYTIQTWRFGNSLAFVNLPGEVVVDYSLRLKRELDGRRLWINAYTNEAPCYIPSERILKEGGYEGGGAMIYYDVPAPFKPGLEKPIIDAVHEQVGSSFTPGFDPKKTHGTLPESPQQSTAALRAKSNLKVDLVVAEPLIVSPVAIDFGPDGRLWVAEMLDYPAGTKGTFEPGGRVRLLEDTKGTGVFDKSTVFLDNIPFPTGIKVWRNGVLVCSAPDILYAEDTKRDGKANVVRKLYSGFGNHNYQARVNSLEYSLDNWLYGSCGLFGGAIKNFHGDTFPLGDRDFRIKPDTGVIEPATGRTQQGRVRDEWDNWFGCDNSNLCWHYVLADHYLLRNPHVAPPNTIISVNDYPDANHLYTAKKDLQMFKLSGPAFYTTSACGLGIYRDDLLGSEYTGNTFTCEPVNLSVHRLKISPRGSTFSGRRPPEEAQSEFLSSTDNWTRPVQVKTGPDGGLWVVDMYRFVIEHPQWIPPEDLAQLDARAGSSMGRIYRIRPQNKSLRSWLRLDKLDTAGLVAALDSPNGWQRDMASQMLLWSPDQAAIKPLEKLATDCDRPEARLHALCVLDGLQALKPEMVEKAIADKNPGVRRHAIRLAEPFLNKHPDLGDFLVARLNDADAQVRLQLAYSLGAWRDARAGKSLATLALAHREDVYLIAAVLSSVNGRNVHDMITEILSSPSPPEQLTHELLSLVAVLNDGNELPSILKKVIQPKDGRFATWQLAALAGMFDALERRGQSLEPLLKEEQGVKAILSSARKIGADHKAAGNERLAAVALLGIESSKKTQDLEILSKLLVPQNSAPLQSAAIKSMGRIADDQVPALTLAGWKTHTPTIKTQILDVLFSRPAWQSRLVEALEKKEIPASQIDGARRQRLLNHKDETTRTLAAKAFAGASNADRQKVLADYHEVTTLVGDRTRGKAVFGKTCSVCHHLENVGSAVGPDLVQVMNKSPLYLLTEILDPNKNVDTRYIEYQAVLKNGRTFTGLMATESATSIALRGQGGKEQVILRTEIDELHSTGKSLMPEGLEKDVSKQAMADLIAYLTANSLPPKLFIGNKPAVVKPVGGTLSLLATQCEIYGDRIDYETDFRNIGMWQGEKDHVIWNIDLEKGGDFDVYFDYSCHNDSAGNVFAFEGGEPTLEGKVEGTGGWDKYHQMKVGTIKLTPGSRRLIVRPAGPLTKEALLDLRGVHLVPNGEKLKRVDN
ncbi:MAG: neutral/alkaline non-lysosomal ceramidase N-terminal domain-containing protein [Gemmataceae bacterium]